MPSPFQQLANLTVAFQLPASGTPDTYNAVGNPALDTSDLIAVAYAVQKNTQRQTSSAPLQDGELSQLKYEGYWVRPLQCPQTIQAEQIGPAIIWRLASDFALPVGGWADRAAYDAFVAANESRVGARGDFVLAPNPPDPFGVAGALGDRFSGYLITRVAWADAL